MRKSLFVIAVGVFISSGLLGCKADEKLRISADEAQRQVADRDLQIDRLNRELNHYKNQPSAAERLANMKAENDKLRGSLTGMTKKFKDMENRYAQLRLVRLDPGLDRALRAFAEANKDLVEYDEKLGMVRFRSDLTFGSGSTKISDGARATLGKLAEILNTEAARTYGVRVVGHTDTARIRRVVRLHPTNWHLSVHRAISVRAALEQSGISAVRTFVSGHAYYRPVAQNSTKDGSKLNRRVEIYLVPMPQVDESFLGNAAAAKPATPKTAVARPSE
jgi:chemotaxis protein MotB